MQKIIQLLQFLFKRKQLAYQSIKINKNDNI